MGNHQGHLNNKHGKSTATTPTETIPEVDGPRKASVGRTLSGNDIREKNTTNLQSLQKLGKILASKAVAEEGVNGITLNIFTKYLFPRYPILAEKLFRYFHQLSQSKAKHIGTQAFMQQCDKYLQILSNSTIGDLLVKMFSTHCQDNNNDTITPEALKSLLMCAYHISMDHYSEGPQMCLSISKTLKAVVDSCFHVKNSLSVSYVSHWLQDNCPRLLQPLHRFIVHSLATSYRTLQESLEPNLASGLELATPVLEQPPPFAPGKAVHPHLLNMSMSWLLASALPPLYSLPRHAPTPSNGLNSAAFMSRLMCSIPSHWIMLYDSDDMGLGANRYLHHTLNYKGPTLVLVKADSGALFCIAAPNEWRESHLYWGNEEAAVYQLYPKFNLLEKGAKILYLNVSVRGYPHGLRVGSDPRAPILSIDGTFEKIEFCKIPYSLHTIEVWGCGDAVSRDQQLDIKKWEVKEVERQRAVKLSAADWLDHPDRYLLELAGRPQYHNN